MSDHTKQAPGVVVRKGGGSIVACKPVFTADSRYLLCGSGHSVKVLIVASGHCLRSLDGHSGVVTAIVINPVNKFQALTSSEDKSVARWDYQEAVLLARYWFTAPLAAIYPSGIEADIFYAINSVDHKCHSLVEFKLPKRPSSSGAISTSTLLRDVEPRHNHCAVGAMGMVIASITLRTVRMLDRRDGKKLINEHRFDGRQRMTCVACHPTEFCVATGIDDGRIILWHNFLATSGETSKVIKTILHWHALCVRDLVFTPEGSYLLSAGYECVLVKWQTTTHQRDTLPRLGAPICNLACSPDDQLYAACHVDNGIQLINCNFTVSQHFQGLVRGNVDQQVRHPLAIGMLLDPRSGALVVNGRPGQLQFYDVEADRQLFCLDITNQNYVSPDSIKRPLVLTEVENAAFDETGDWLVTVERRCDGETTDEMRLKFWAHCLEAKTFVLNTSVEAPHNKRIVTIKFRRNVSRLKTNYLGGCHADDDDDDDYVPMIITSSEDASFKLWALVDDTDIYRSNVRWTCDSAGYYHNKPAGPADFSDDGSLLCVGFAEVITFWNPTVNVLCNTVHLGSPDFVVRHLVFGQQSCCHMLYAATNEKLYSWNVLSGTVQAVIMCHATTLVALPSSGNIAVFTQENELFVVNGQKSEICYRHPELTHEPVASAIAIRSASQTKATNLLSWLGNDRLYFMTSSAQDLMTLVPATEVENETAAVSFTKLDQNLPTTAFSRLVAQTKHSSSHIRSVDSSWDNRSVRPDQKLLKEIINTPVHVLPPVSTLCLRFMETLMLRNKTVRLQSGAGAKDEEEDSDNEDDAVEQLKTVAVNSEESDMET